MLTIVPTQKQLIERYESTTRFWRTGENRLFNRLIYTLPQTKRGKYVSTIQVIVPYDSLQKRLKVLFPAEELGLDTKKILLTYFT